MLLKLFKLYCVFCIFLSHVSLGQVTVQLDTIKANRIIELLQDDSFNEAKNLLAGIQEQFEYNNPTKEYVRLLLNVGSVFNEKGNYEASQQYLFSALTLAKENEYIDLEAEALLEIGYVYYFLDQLDKGIEFGEKALIIAEKKSNKTIEATANNLIGILYVKKRQGSIGLQYLQKSLSVRKSQNDSRGIASTLSNLAMYFEEEGEYSRALELQLEGLALDDSIGNTYGTAWSNQMIGVLYIKMKNESKAKVYLQKSSTSAHQLKAKEIILQTYKSFAALYKQEENFEQALSYSNLYNDLRDSIYNSGLAGKVLLFQQSYELSDKNRKIIVQEESIKAQQKFFWWISCALGLSALLSYFYYKAFRKTKNLYEEVAERNEEIQAQAEELTEANQSLTELNAQIAEQHEEIQAQAEELIESNQSVYQLNDALKIKIDNAKAELQHANDELVKHNQELLQFSYTVSHNLRGPVARLLGLMNLIVIEKVAGEKEHLIKLLQQSTLDLDSVLKDLNLIIDTRNKLFKVHEKISLEEEWAKCTSLLGEYIKSDFLIEANFEQVQYLYSIRAIIQSVFYNLLSNAIKYRSPDRKLQVKVVCGLENDQPVLRITDNGLGIDLANQRDNVFKLYKRFHTHVAGKGLGLYLVKSQVEVLGGKIEVESDLNVGTTFSINLPATRSIDKQVFFENEAAQLYYDANINNTVILWKRDISSVEYREVFDAVLQALRTYNSPAWIADLRLQGIITSENQQWFMKSVLPEAVRCGLKRIATVGFTDPIRSLYYQNMIVRTSELGINLQVFEEIEDAKAWMKTWLMEDTV